MGAINSIKAIYRAIPKHTCLGVNRVPAWESDPNCNLTGNNVVGHF